MADDEELNGYEGEKDNEADNVVAADYELAEGFDDCTGSSGALIAVQQNTAGGSRGPARGAAVSAARRRLGKTENCVGRKDLNRREQHQHGGGDAYGQAAGPAESSASARA